MRVIYTALFSAYEELKTPKVITEGWRYIAYTDQPLTSDVWEIRQVANVENPRLTAREFKLTRFTEWEQSIWVDASFVIDTDLNIWWDKYFKGGLTAPTHPLRNCVYNEALDCIIAQRGNADQVRAQIKEYEQLGIPKNNGVITSGLLMRENTPEVIKLCNDWWEELKTHSIRDQISFAKVSIPFKEIVHTYNWDYRKGQDFVYFHHFMRRGGSHVKMSKV